MDYGADSNVYALIGESRGLADTPWPMFNHDVEHTGNYLAERNLAPDTPSTPSGHSTGDIATLYSFTTSSSDPEGDSISYKFDWGDGTTSSWGSASQDHSWSSAGTYQVKAQAKDEFGATSAWSNSTSIDIQASDDSDNGSDDSDEDSDDSSGGGGGGCTMSANASFGLSWIILFTIPLFMIVRRRL